MKLKIAEELQKQGVSIDRLAFILKVPESNLSELISCPDFLPIALYFRFRAFLNKTDAQLIDFEPDVLEKE